MTKNGTATTKRFRTESDSVQPTIYQIRLEGHLDFQWSDCFGGLTIMLENGDTLLTGPVVDQAALFGLLKKIAIWECRWSHSIAFSPVPSAVEKLISQIFERRKK